MCKARRSRSDPSLPPRQPPPSSSSLKTTFADRAPPRSLRHYVSLTVAQIDASTWAIGARGDVGCYANKLLVLMDGRTLYTPTYGGVYWDVQDTFIADVERIEVILGPGGAIWAPML